MSNASLQARYERRRARAMILLAIFYVVAGYLHLASPAAFVRVTPAWVPYPDAFVLATGLSELAGVIALLVPRTRKFGAVALSIYAICVYPANIGHAVQDLSVPNNELRWLYHAPRLFAQPLIVWWTLYAGGVICGLRLPPKVDRPR